MKRYIRASEVLQEKPGFYFTFGNKGIFLQSDAKNLTDHIVRKFINAVCDYKGASDAIRDTALYNQADLKEFRRRIDKATLSLIDTGKITYYSIQGNNFTVNYPEEDFKEDIILI